jgi:flagellar protein FlaF
MSNDAFAGYGRVRQHTASPRQAEREVLEKLARRLRAEDPSPAERAAAIQTNLELWTTFALDLRDPENGLPEALKASLLSLAIFVIKRSPQVLRGEADAAILAQINEGVAAGLSSQNAQEAA